VLLAQQALTLQDIAGARLRLGIGVSHRPSMVDGLGLDMGRPLDVTREYVSVLRAALTGKVDHVGARYRAVWQSGLPRVPDAPSILLAGLAPKMLELAGEIADGVVLWLCAPAYIRDQALPALRRGRERAGKSFAGVPLALTVDPAAGTALFRAELGRYLALPFYRAMLELSGFGEDLRAWDRRPGPDAISERLVSALAGIGDYQTLGAFVSAHREAGVTLPAIRPIAFPDAPHYLPTIEAAINT
jgi:alkanesulfonate monooxygenase SsuD/methylene tetrahydromethanopterin reductase-like flavin-dependent oxidoreductase (luciferase family)